MKYIMLLFISTLSIARPHNSIDQIDWFKGPVEKAFEKAQKENRPLFLYWGAVWCPPCNQIKKTIFTHPLFHQAAKNFIAVYLDGDNSKAQLWGEKLKSKGYPTMMILNPAGKEVTRLPTGLKVGEYVSLMDSALKNLVPIEVLLKKGLIGQANDQEWKQLSGYSWAQDHHQYIDPENKITTFETLYQSVPAKLKLEKSKLFFLYLDSLAEKTRENDQKNPLIPNKKLRVSLQNQLKTVLQSDALIRANLESLFFNGKSILAALYENKDPQRKKMADVWQTILNQIQSDSSYSNDERLSALIFEVEQLTPETTPKELQQKIVRLTELAEKNIKSDYDRQAAMSTAIYLLRETGQLKKAKKLALTQIKKSTAPYYFMSYLSGIEKRLGNKKMALSWLEKAWKTSQGQATRFQWGVDYLNGIVEFSPDNEKTLLLAAPQVVSEVLHNEDAFSGRNKYRFEKLKKTFHSLPLQTKTKLVKKLEQSCKLNSLNKKQCEQWTQSF